MKGRIFKRCKDCGVRVPDDVCEKCGSRSTSWAYRVLVGKDAKGRPREQYRSGFPRKKDAERALTDVLASIQRGTYVPRTNITVGEYLEGEWLSATAPPRVKHQTWSDRRRNLEQHVTPHVGAVRLQALTAAHLNRLYADLMASKEQDGGAGLSPTSVRRIHAIIRKALNDALRWGFVDRNVALLADPPAAKTVRAAQRRSMTTWTADELRRFLHATRDHPLHAAWAFAAFTGLRRSEVLGLRWSDVDLDAAFVQVHQTILEDGEGGYVPVVDQKSQSSARTIHLDRQTVALLRSHREEVARLRRAAGPAWEEHDLVFPAATGRWWTPDSVTQAFRRARESAGLRRIRLHDLRHTHATLLLRAGVNPKVVSERLGHSSVAFTLDTYAHVMPGMQPEAAEQFMDLVLGPDETPDQGHSDLPDQPDDDRDEAAGEAGEEE